MTNKKKFSYSKQFLTIYIIGLILFSIYYLIHYLMTGSGFESIWVIIYFLLAPLYLLFPISAVMGAGLFYVIGLLIKITFWDSVNCFYDSTENPDKQFKLRDYLYGAILIVGAVIVLHIVVYILTAGLFSFIKFIKSVGNF